jgi:hypothetical protein
MSDRKKFAPVIKQHSLKLQSSEQRSYTWFVPKVKSFDELLLSWNAVRPVRGHYVILCSVYVQNHWSSWLLYAVWGTHHQYSFHDTSSQDLVHSFQDQIQIIEGQIATGFRIRIEACDGATLENFYTLYACCSFLKSFKFSSFQPLYSSLVLPIRGLSQLCLNHPRTASFCSPSSTTAVIQYVFPDKYPSPLQFAKNVYDAGFNIYGNWSFNTAQAFVELGLQWQCLCARAEGFETIWYYLKRGLPVIVSLKGVLRGSQRPYLNGHLMVIKGYDALSQQILCMDPAFLSDELTSMRYDWREFMQAWQRHHYIAYFFFPKNRGHFSRSSKAAGMTHFERF